MLPRPGPCSPLAAWATASKSPPAIGERQEKQAVWAELTLFVQGSGLLFTRFVRGPAERTGENHRRHPRFIAVD